MAAPDLSPASSATLARQDPAARVPTTDPACGSPAPATIPRCDRLRRHVPAAVRETGTAALATAPECGPLRRQAPAAVRASGMPDRQAAGRILAVATFLGALLFFSALRPAGAVENPARADSEQYTEELNGAAEAYLRTATHGAAAVDVNEVGYLQARRYYRHLLLLRPGDTGALSSQQVVEAQLARFRRQHRWRLFKSAVVHSLWGSPSTRYINNGTELGAGRASFDVEADWEIIEDLTPSDQWILTYGRRSVPFLWQMQLGFANEEPGLDGLPEDGTSMAAHAGTEVAYTVLPMLRYLLPYVGVGYRGMFVRYTDDFGDGQFYFHGTYLRLGTILSLGRTLKVGFGMERSLRMTNSDFDASEYPVGNALDVSCEDCIDSWTAAQIDVELSF